MKSSGKHKTTNILTALLTVVAMTGGCADMGDWFGSGGGTDGRLDVPKPVNLLLPKKINIHPFTTTRTFDDEGGIKGVEVRVEAFNAFQEATRAFGDFRFEIHTHQSNNLEPKKELRGVWEIEPSMLDAKENLRYWNRSQQMYEFKLQWDKPIPIGQKFVVVAVFTSPFTGRLTAQNIFTSGQ